MKREDMGRDFLPPTRRACNPRIEKIFAPLPQTPESRFSQAGKAIEDTPKRPRGFPGTRPHPQDPLRTAIRLSVAAPADAESLRRPELDPG